MEKGKSLQCLYAVPNKNTCKTATTPTETQSEQPKEKKSWKPGFKKSARPEAKKSVNNEEKSSKTAAGIPEPPYARYHFFIMTFRF